MNAPMRPPGSASPSAPASPRFVWDDPFLLDDQLTEDERAIRDVAQSFAQEQLLPGIVEAYADEKTDPGLFRKMGELGLLGVTLPEEYGCAGASYVAYGLVARAVEAVDFRLPLDDERAILPRHVPDPRLRLGGTAPEVPAEARLGGMDRLLRPHRARCRLGPAGMKTKAEKIDGGYRISGAKMWISNAPFADVFVVWAKSDAHEGAIRASSWRRA